MDGSFYRCTFNEKGETTVTTSNFLALPSAVGSVPAALGGDGNATASQFGDLNLSDGGGAASPAP
jgi:hypothetical protein